MTLAMETEAVAGVGRTDASGADVASGATTFRVPTPPSLNNAWKNVSGRGRVKTPAYRAWIEDAGWNLAAQRPRRWACPVIVSVVIDIDRGDLDNRLKAIGDLLTTHKVVRDDIDIVAWMAAKSGSCGGWCEVTVAAVTDMTVRFLPSPSGLGGSWARV